MQRLGTFSQSAPLDIIFFVSKQLVVVTRDKGWGWRDEIQIFSSFLKLLVTVFGMTQHTTEKAGWKYLEKVAQAKYSV